VDGRYARGHRRLDKPVDDAPRDSAPLVRRTHRQQHEMRALVAEFHDAKPASDSPLRATSVTVSGSSINSRTDCAR
jgi:hypothetical protein